MKPKNIIILMVVLLFLIVILQNTQVVTLRLFFWEITMSRIILLALTSLIGFALGYVVGGISANRPKDK